MLNDKELIFFFVGKILRLKNLVTQQRRKKTIFVNKFEAKYPGVHKRVHDTAQHAQSVASPSHPIYIEPQTSQIKIRSIVSKQYGFH